jgi:uncharacterized membrane protein
MTQSTHHKAGRFSEIDALRGLAVLLMVFNHGLNWSYAGTAYNIVAIFGTLSLGDIATPMFYLAAGISLYFSLQSRLRKDRNPIHIRAKYCIRLGKLFIIGFFMSLGWGVLQAQAVTLLALAWLVLSLLPNEKLESVFSVLPWLILISLGAHFLIANLRLSPSLHLVFAGQFPLFAILAINGIGFCLAPRLHWPAFSTRHIALGLGMMLTAVLYAQYASPMIRHGASLSFLAFGLGLSSLILGIMHNKGIQKLTLFRYLAMVGKDSLFLYIFHYVAFLVPFYFSGFMLNLSAAAAVVFSSAMTAMIVFTAYLRRHSRLSVYHIFDRLTSTLWAYLQYPLNASSRELLRSSYYRNTYPGNVS